MIYCINHQTLQHFGALLISNFRLRYRMIVEGQYWDVGRFQGMEYDQYDTPAAAHLVWADDKGAVRGSLRVAPTDRPYMIRDLWPDMVAAGPLPHSLSVWEASRFCVDHALPSPLRHRVKQELVCALLEFGLKNDVSEMIGVMPDKFWKSCFISNGWDIEYLGSGKTVDSGDVIIAGRMPVTLGVLRAVRAKTGIGPASLRMAPEAPETEMPPAVRKAA